MMHFFCISLNHFSPVFTFCVLQEDTMKLSDFLEEAAIMKEMKHPNLVQVNSKSIFMCWLCIN